MGFLTSTILSGVIWDGIKGGTKLTSNYLKNSLKDWILDGQDYLDIIEEIDNAPDYAIRSEKYLEAFIDENKAISEILLKARQVSKNNMTNNTFNNSPVMQGGSGNKQINYNNSFNGEKVFKDKHINKGND